MKTKTNTKKTQIEKKNSDEKFFDNLKYIKYSNFNKIFYNGNSYINNIDKENILIKEIKGDGNCFFRAISYYIHNTEKYHNNYRELAYQMCLNILHSIKIII